MKVKRQKHVRKILTFYRSSFGYHSPFQVLVDGTFCRAALNCKVNISEQLPKYLDGEVKLCTTQCVLAECEAMGSLLYGPLKILQQYAVVPCKHKRPILPFNCLHKLAVATKKGKAKYFIATQDENLTECIRQLPGVALLYVAFNAINLESPSESSRLKATERLQNSMEPAVHEQTTLQCLKESTFGKRAEFVHKRKRIKGPNPLSCKKKKLKEQLLGTSRNSRKRKRKRSRKRAKTSLQSVTNC